MEAGLETSEPEEQKTNSEKKDGRVATPTAGIVPASREAAAGGEYQVRQREEGKF